MSTKILVIDDHQETLQLIGIILGRHDYEVFTAQSGLEGLDTARRVQPDLVLLDVMMPGMDGFEVCREFRLDAALDAIPIMMFTARSQIEDKEMAYRAGATEYLVKPTRPKVLVHHVQEVLSKFLPDTSKSTSEQSTSTTTVIGVLGRRANSGTTLVALNLAAIFARQDRATRLVDLTGDDRDLKQLYATGANDSGLPINMQFIAPNTIDLDAATALVTAAHEQEDSVVVLDLGNHITPAVQAFIPHIDHVVMCIRPDLQKTSDVQQACDELKLQVSEKSACHLAILNFDGQDKNKLDDIRRTIRQPIAVTIPISKDHVAEAAERRIPMVQLSPDSETSTQFQNLANLMQRPAA